jgi:hypothetical protein
MLDRNRLHRGQRSIAHFASNGMLTEASRTRALRIPSESVDSMVLTVYMKDKSTHAKKFGNRTDAIFLSQFSAQEMLYRYYDSKSWFWMSERKIMKPRRDSLQADINRIWAGPRPAAR